MIGKILLFNDRDFSSDGFYKSRRRGVIVAKEGNRLLIALTRGLGKGNEKPKRDALAKKGILLKLKDNTGQEFYLTHTIVDSYFSPIIDGDLRQIDSKRTVDHSHISTIEKFLFSSKKTLTVGKQNSNIRKNFKNYK